MGSHLLLVEPFQQSGSISYRAVSHDHSGDALHSGGIVWLGSHLYVADTQVGLRVFDLSRVMRVSNTDDSKRIGLDVGAVP